MQVGLEEAFRARSGRDLMASNNAPPEMREKLCLCEITFLRLEYALSFGVPVSSSSCWAGTFDFSKKTFDTLYPNFTQGVILERGRSFPTE